MCQRLICSLPIETGSTLTPMIVAGFSNAVAWLAAQLKAYPAVQATEILNEPDNVYRLSERSNWKQKYITLLNSAYTVMKTVSPQMTVIGLGAQAGDDFAMMSYGAHAEGLTAILTRPHSLFQKLRTSLRIPHLQSCARHGFKTINTIPGRVRIQHRPAAQARALRSTLRLKRLGLYAAPKLAIGDGSLGFSRASN